MSQMTIRLIIVYLGFCYYINSTSEKFLLIYKDTNIKLAFFSDNKLNRFIKIQKDAFPKFDNKNVIYKICCEDCETSYVGQTCRKFSNRICEHRRHINWNTHSVNIVLNFHMTSIRRTSKF